MVVIQVGPMKESVVVHGREGIEDMMDRIEKTY